MNTDVADEPEVVYPESDGKPMAESTKQWNWIVKVVGELKALFDGQEVFVAGDLFWYPVKGNAKIVAAPDGLVVFGRPPGDRGSYRQWLEGGIAPQVVFEVLSPSNTDDEMVEKRAFYERHGVLEYYVIDPEVETYEAYRRRGNALEAVPRDDLHGFVSPLLTVRFENLDGLRIVRPDGRAFQFVVEREREIVAERARQVALLRAKDAEIEAKDAEIEAKDAEIEAKDAELKAAADQLVAERLEKAKLADQIEQSNRRQAAVDAYLRQLGIDPTTLRGPS